MSRIRDIGMLLIFPIHFPRKFKNQGSQECSVLAYVIDKIPPAIYVIWRGFLRSKHWKIDFINSNVICETRRQRNEGY